MLSHRACPNGFLFKGFAHEGGNKSVAVGERPRPPRIRICLDENIVCHRLLRVWRCAVQGRYASLGRSRPVTDQ